MLTFVVGSCELGKFISLCTITPFLSLINANIVSCVHFAIFRLCSKHIEGWQGGRFDKWLFSPVTPQQPVVGALVPLLAPSPIRTVDEDEQNTSAASFNCVLNALLLTSSPVFLSTNFWAALVLVAHPTTALLVHACNFVRI